MEQIYIFSLNKKTFFNFILINFIQKRHLLIFTLHLYKDSQINQLFYQQKTNIFMTYQYNISINHKKH